MASIGLDSAKFGTHSLRRTKAVLIYRRPGNLRAVQLLLGHSKIESTVRYLHRGRRRDRDSGENRYLITHAVTPIPDMVGGAPGAADCSGADFR
jgi:integrase